MAGEDPEADAGGAQTRPASRFRRSVDAPDPGEDPVPASVGVRALARNVSGIVAAVVDTGRPTVITKHGRPVALVVSLVDAPGFGDDPQSAQAAGPIEPAAAVWRGPGRSAETWVGPPGCGRIDAV